MKTWQRCLVIGAIGALSAVPQGNSAENSARPSDISPEMNLSSPYRTQEFSIDLFGSGSVGQETIDHISGNRVRENGRLGAGVGVNYFFTRHCGLSGEAYSENTQHSFFDSASLNLVGRLPLGESGVAPYIFGGGGYQFDAVEQWLGNAGGGVEFRFTRYWGIFADARYVFTDKTQNYGLARAGVRLAF